MLPVYVIHYDRPEWTSRSIATLRASVGVDVVVTVVDNGGREPQVPTGVRVLRTGANLGFSGAANVALRDWLPTGDDWVVIAAHDLLVAPDTFERMLDAAGRHPRLGLVGPPYADVPDGAREAVLGDAGELRLREWVNGSCMMLRRGCVDATGYFDEEYGSFWEDIDYGWRVRHAGWDVADVPAAAAARTLGRAGGSRAEVLRHANRLLFAAKRGGSRAVLGAASTLVKQAVWAVLHRDLRSAKENLVGLGVGVARAARCLARPLRSRASRTPA